MARPDNSTGIIFIAAIIFVLLLSVLSYIRIISLIESSELVNHTTQVTLELETLKGNLRNAEIGQRGYLLTKDSQFLEPYYQGLKDYSDNLARLRELIKDNPSQQINLATLDTIAARRMERLQQVLELSKTRIPDKNDLLVGESISDSFRLQANKMIDVENNLLNQRNEQMQKHVFFAPAMLFILVLVALSILILSYWKLNKVLLESHELKAEAIKHQIYLEKSKEIEESVQRFHNLIYTSPSAIGILNGEDLRITIGNEPIIKIWGKGKEIIGKPYFEALPELAEQGYREVFAQVYKTGIPFNAIETPVHILQDGVATLKYYNFILFPQRNIENQVDGIGIIATEVTSQALLNNTVKESEQQYRELSLSLEEKVNERTAELNTKNIELQKMNKELQSFAYISGHDLQEPLRKIQTFAARIVEKEEKNLSENGKDYFKRMQNAAERMKTLINDLLTYSRTATADRKFEMTDLNKIIAEVKEDLKEELIEKQATIETIELCPVTIIPFQFRQLMHNLIGNALKFSNTQTPPHIKIKCEIETGIKLGYEKLSPQTRYCHISISDNGIGFEQQYAEKIFEVFQRLHGKSEYEGTGIGLAIVKRIVENHEGIITATGELNKGATFDIYIPET
jgi:signal transduction histidine kinase/CHASE3 domain sensor protein